MRFGAGIPIADVSGLEVQFRYLFVTSARGFHGVDVTHPERPGELEGAFRPLEDAGRLYLDDRGEP